MIYDCFTFFNELDLLEIRLNILNDVVDKFVLVEATKTFSGKDKPLYYEQNKERFSKFKDKIIHVVVDDFPEPDETTQDVAFMVESYQRNAIMRGLKGAKDDDVIIIADLDEIPNPDVLSVLDCSGDKIYWLRQKMFYYFINYLNISEPYWNYRVKVLSYKNLCHYCDNMNIKYDRFISATTDKKTTPNKIRMLDDGICVRNGGWHFSFLGGVDAIIKKIQSFSHQEYNNEEYINKDKLLKRISNGEDLFGRDEYHYIAIPLDESFPKYIVENQEKYSNLIFKITPQYKLKLIIKKIILAVLILPTNLVIIAKYRKRLKQKIKMIM